MGESVEPLVHRVADIVVHIWLDILQISICGNDAKIDSDIVT